MNQKARIGLVLDKEGRFEYFWIEAQRDLASIQTLRIRVSGVGRDHPQDFDLWVHDWLFEPGCRLEFTGLLLNCAEVIESLKNIAKQILPHGISEYSIRRHEYMRCGFPSGRASRMALSPARYEAFCDSRLNLLPKEITGRLSTCVDAGAHTGAWTEALLDVFCPQRVILLECEPRLVDQLRTKFSARREVEIIDAALCDTSGTATFYQLRHPASSSLLQPRAEAAREYEHSSWDVVGEVPVKTIPYDEVVAREKEVSILKLDIQGAERGVISKSRSGIEKTNAVLLEVNFTQHYSNDAIFPELHTLMMEKGFGLYRLSSIYHRGGRALFADAAYVREEILRDLAPAPG